MGRLLARCNHIKRLDDGFYVSIVSGSIEDTCVQRPRVFWHRFFDHVGTGTSWAVTSVSRAVIAFELCDDQIYVTPDSTLAFESPSMVRLVSSPPRQVGYVLLPLTD